MAADLKTADIGVYGLGTMGSALALNLAEQGFRVAVSNREADWIAPFLEEAGPLADHLSGHATLEDFVDSIAQPRSILFMIPSGAPMDAMIDAVMPLLDEGDTIIDGGNADFHDTRRRAADREAGDESSCQESASQEGSCRQNASQSHVCEEACRQETCRSETCGQESRAQSASGQKE